MGNSNIIDSNVFAWNGFRNNTNMDYI